MPYLRLCLEVVEHFKKLVCLGVKSFSMRWVGIRGEQIPRFSRFRSKTAHFNSLRPRVSSDYFSLEDILVFWRSGAYKKYPI